MRQKSFSDGGGTVITLGNSRDWAKLKPTHRRLVSSALRAAFEAGPDYFSAAARQVKHPGLARFCAACARAKPKLEIYDTRLRGRAAFLSLKPGKQRLLLDFQSPKQVSKGRRLPRELREVYETVGGIALDFGSSGSLISPAELRTLDEVWARDAEAPDDPTELHLEIGKSLATVDVRALKLGFELDESGMREVEAVLRQAAKQMQQEPPTLPSLKVWSRGAPISHGRLKNLVPFFEDSGDYLCFSPKGQALFVGWETGGIMEFGTVGSALNAVFEHLLSGTGVMNEFVLAP